MLACMCELHVLRNELGFCLFFVCVIIQMDARVCERRGLFAAWWLHPTVPLATPQGEKDLVSGDTVPD